MTNQDYDTVSQGIGKKGKSFRIYPGGGRKVKFLG
jgi:hypothetical protein